MTGKDLVKLLKGDGWRLEHVRGSHHVLRKDSKQLSVPVHAGKDLGKGLLTRLLKGGRATMKSTHPRALAPGFENSIYWARIAKQRGGGYLVEFPDLPGCITEGRTIDDARANAHEALSGWLFVALKHGDAIPVGRTRRQRGYHRVIPDLDVAVPLVILSARKGRRLTQAAVAKALGITQQAYRKFETPGKSNPTLRTLERISEVLGLELVLRAA